MSNRLAHETSPYLKQHLDNPVDWYPWGDEAFAVARRVNKPVLLSIGYSACHWCHVMAHESFEDEATAAVMNELFVNIKVDREERPDIDRIYQLAHQLLTQRGGGWPLTMFLDGDDQRPFFGGTYFPREARYGMPPFSELLQQVSDYYAKERDSIRQQTVGLAAVFKRLEPVPSERAISAEPLQQARDAFAASLDKEYGGFGDAPKFPHPTTIDRLLRHWRASANDAEPDVEALFMATLTLKRMADGGLFDHVGGGFCRYAVDRYWQIPHFEKMLYDNGPLLAIYAQASIASGERAFAETANATADWLLNDMRAPNGGFYSARDADSEGAEGKFYLWSPQEVSALLGDAYPMFAGYYGLDAEANFEGRWHLTLRSEIAENDRNTVAAARQRLHDARRQRIAPARDEKQLAAWNALTIRGLAIAGRALNRADLVDAASDALQFVRTHLMQEDRLLASYADGKAQLAAYLDDYAFLLDATLELLQSRWDSDNLHLTVQLAEALLEHFEDKDAGGFFFTAHDHETLMHRPRPFADEALPSGNGVAAFALQRLGFLLGESRYLDAAARTLQSAWLAIEEYPRGHVSLLNAVDEYLQHPEIVIIRGQATEIAQWQASAAAIYAPRRMVFAIPADADDLPGVLADRQARDGESVAYRCVGTHCELPVTTWEALAAQLSEADNN